MQSAIKKFQNLEYTEFTYILTFSYENRGL